MIGRGALAGLSAAALRVCKVCACCVAPCYCSSVIAIRTASDQFSTRDGVGSPQYMHTEAVYESSERLRGDS
jgi:hypothetical protein